MKFAVREIVIIAVLVLASFIIHEYVHWMQYEAYPGTEPVCIAFNPCAVTNQNCAFSIYEECADLSIFRPDAVFGCQYELNTSFMGKEEYEKESEARESQATLVQVIFVIGMLLALGKHGLKLH